MGCGSSQKPQYQPKAEQPGDTVSPPSLFCLPSQGLHEDEYSQHLKKGTEFAQESLSLKPPAPPARTDSESITQWSNTELQSWLQLKLKAVNGAQSELDKASYVSIKELIVAGATVGIIYEDIATVIQNLPLPDEIKNDRDAISLFREVAADQSQPFIEKADRAYKACALNAESGPEDMGLWSPFCAGRRMRMLDAFEKTRPQVPAKSAPPAAK